MKQFIFIALFLVSYYECREIAEASPQYILGKRDIALSKRWGSFSDLANSAGSAFDTVSDHANGALDKATELAEQGQALGQDLQDSGYLDQAMDLVDEMPNNLDQVKQIAESQGLPTDLATLEQLATDLNVPVSQEDLQEFVTQMDFDYMAQNVPAQDILSVGAGVINHVNGQQGAAAASAGASMESTLLSMEILEKITEAKTLLESVAACNEEDEEPIEEMKRPGGLLKQFAGKRMTQSLHDMMGKRTVLPTHEEPTFAKRSGSHLLAMGKRPGSHLLKMGKKSGSHLLAMGKRPGSHLLKMGKKDVNDDLATILGQGVEMGVGSIPLVGDSLLGGGAAAGGAAPAAGGEDGLYTILDGLNEIVAKLQQLA